MNDDAARVGVRGQPRPRRPALPLGLGAAALLLIAAYGPLWALTRDPQIDSFPGATALVALALAAVGVVVARHEPANPVGWLLLVGGLGVIAGTDGALYAVLDYRLHGGRLPLGPVAVLVSWLWQPAVVLAALVVLVFPDGHLPAPRWRWGLRGYLVAAGLWAPGTLAITVGGLLRAPIRIDLSGDLALVDHPRGWAVAVSNIALVGLGLMVLGWALFAIRAVVSWRQATGVRRQQMTWLMSGTALTVVSTIPVVLLGTLAASTAPTGLVGAATAVLSVGTAALPVTIGVAILRYRLYDIDRLVSRTVAYAIVTAALAGLYFGLVALTTRVIDLGSALGVAASTLAAAALFTPLRRRLQRRVDRRFNRAGCDADAVIAAFTGRLRDTVELETVRADLVGTIAEAMEPTHLVVWLRDSPAGPGPTPAGGRDVRATR